MTALLSPNAKQQFFDDAGNPAAGFSLFTYAANTTTPQATYTNRAGTVANANPIILDARGEATVYLTPGIVYDYVLKTAADVTVWTREDVSADAGDAAAVFFDDTLAPAYLKTVSQIVSGEPVSALRFVNPAQHSGIRDFTSSYDASADMNTALESGAKSLLVPYGLYNFEQQLVKSNGPLSIVGDGVSASRFIWRSSAASTGIQVTLTKPASWTDTCTVQGVELITEKAAQGTALRIISPALSATDRVSPRAFARDILMRGATGPLEDGWLNGLWLDNCTNSLVDNCHFIGKVNAAEPVYDSLAAFRYENNVGASPHQSAVTYRDCIVHYAQTGYNVFDTEGAQFTNCTAVGVNVGAQVGGPANFPHFRWDGGHCNASDACIIVDAIAQAIITQGLFYKELGGSTGIGISVRNGASDFQLLGNQFENLSADAGMNAIVIDNSDRGVIDGNYFRRVDATDGAPTGTAIWIANGSEDVEIGDANKFAPTLITTRILDQGVRTVQPDMGALVTMSSNQSVTASTAATVTWGAAAEIGEFWDAVANTRLTAPVAGRYIFIFNLVWDGSATGTREVWVRKNGADANGLPRELINIATAFTKQNLTGEVLLNAGDYLEVIVLSSADSAVLSDVNTWAEIRRQA